MTYAKSTTHQAYDSADRGLKSPFTRATPSADRPTSEPSTVSLVGGRRHDDSHMPRLLHPCLLHPCRTLQPRRKFHLDEGPVMTRSTRSTACIAVPLAAVVIVLGVGGCKEGKVASASTATVTEIATVTPTTTTVTATAAPEATETEMTTDIRRQPSQMLMSPNRQPPSQQSPNRQSLVQQRSLRRPTRPGPLGRRRDSATLSRRPTHISRSQASATPN